MLRRENLKSYIGTTLAVTSNRRKLFTTSVSNYVCSSVLPEVLGLVSLFLRRSDILGPTVSIAV
jgi:hypothetical protein